MTIIHADLSSSVTGSVYNEHILPSLKRKNKIVAFNLFQNIGVDCPKELEIYNAEGNFFKYMFNLYKISKRENIIFNFHSVHVSFFLLIGYIISSIRNMKKIHTVHTSFGNYKLRNKILAILSYIISDEVIFCSHSSYESHPNILKKYLKNKYKIIQNGVNLKLIDCINIKKKNEKFTIIFLGRLIDIKKPLFIIDMFGKKLYKQNIELKIIGEGYLEDKIKEYINKKKLQKKIILKGLLTREKVYEELKKGDLLISASIIEGFPISVLEAIGCKCGVILSDIPSHRELKKSINNIIIFDNENILDLEKKVQNYMKKSIFVKEKELEENYQILKEKYEIERVLEKYEEEYINLANNNTRRRRY